MGVFQSGLLKNVRQVRTVARILYTTGRDCTAGDEGRTRNSSGICRKRRVKKEINAYVMTKQVYSTHPGRH